MERTCLTEIPLTRCGQTGPAGFFGLPSLTPFGSSKSRSSQPLRGKLEERVIDFESTRREEIRVRGEARLPLRPIEARWRPDADAEAVAKVQGGDYEAFEALINRHTPRVYRILLAILRSPDEAQEAMQDTFLKAFQHLGEFQGRSKFLTWLVSIASNTGLQTLRCRRHLQSIDDSLVKRDEDFRPRQIRTWTEDPEQLYSKTESQALVRESIRKLPAKYRVVLMLRDIEQLSIEEAAAALGLGVSAVKSRHWRGRLMLREALTPHFGANAERGTT